MESPMLMDIQKSAEVDAVQAGFTYSLDPKEKGPHVLQQKQQDVKEPTIKIDENDITMDCKLATLVSAKTQPVPVSRARDLQEDFNEAWDIVGTFIKGTFHSFIAFCGIVVTSFIGHVLLWRMSYHK